ncbi:uncharacterized protein LOC113557029 [Rhopalosiphum maidis]|uniref:uncharacterized protein LOC113557029 n=1 Tax=Rhopalosiphum maidis TaxID=43146 RepID=UPI000F00E2F1|nr:uncharacterized protein LOC113557029 [Rhopalosiphum maidis]
MKLCAISNKESANQILLSIAHGCNSIVCSKLGNSDALRRTIRRARCKYALDEPENLLFSLPDKWKTTIGGEAADFLIYDNGNEHRILIFVANEGLSFLSSSNIWFMGGTFKCSSIFTNYYRF